jgi:Holliday junction resolvase
MSRRFEKVTGEKITVSENKDKANRQEKRLAKEFGGVTTAASGSGRNKGDIDIRRFKIEVKRTDKQSLAIKKEWLVKIDEEAYGVGKDPALIIEIDGEEWAVIPKRIFKQISEE